MVTGRVTHWSCFENELVLCRCHVGIFGKIKLYFEEYAMATDAYQKWQHQLKYNRELPTILAKMEQNLSKPLSQAKKARFQLSSAFFGNALHCAGAPH